MEGKERKAVSRLEIRVGKGTEGEKRKVGIRSKKERERWRE